MPSDRSQRWRARCIALLLGVSPVLVNAGQGATASNSIDTIISEIETLEGASDPKCYATASRLENFMFGTPLSGEARSSKNELQKQLISEIWQRASAGPASETLGHSQIERAMAEMLEFQQEASGHWRVSFPAGRQVRINGTDKRQYSSIAYSLRALLAVQQQSLLNPESNLRPLSEAAVNLLKDASDLYTLSVLKIADGVARSQSNRELSEELLLSVWRDLGGEAATGRAAVPAAPLGDAPADLSLAHAVIDQKVRSYAKYNDISNQLFVRNLQVYFAKRRWPADSEEARAFRGFYTETLIQMARDIYLGAQSLAVARGSALIQEPDVASFLAGYVPHRVNEYEDAIFFPALPRSEQVEIESYDMDAFRDSGIHWRYLQFALQSDGFAATLAPDPFALELIAENIAQLGVLLLRLTGDTEAADGQVRLSSEQLVDAVKLFRQRVAAHHRAGADHRPGAPGLKSAARSGESAVGGLFVEVSEQMGLDYMHRSSDWLSRLLRSYLQKDENTGLITIPPAFGGSGVAVGDINNDSRDDILLLGGLGPQLLAAGEDGRFRNITPGAGLNWLRPDDRRPGEMRQPLLADLDNDGDQDIVITYVDDEHRVYRNNGDETFEDVTALANLGGSELVGGPAVVFDYDNDGLLDIYVTYFGNYLRGVLPTLKRRNFNGLPNRLFRNLGNFRFEDVTEGSGLDNTGWAQAVTHTDFNLDGLQDLVVGNDFGINAYYKNLGNGRFVDVAADLQTDKPSYTMGIGISDLNDDLVPDFYISNIVIMNKDQKYVLPSADTAMVFDPAKMSHMRVLEANDLFLSGERGSAVSYELSQAVERGYSSTGWAWGAEFFDSDNDGDDDLYVLNGMNEFNVYSNENPYYTDPLENSKREAFIPVDTRETNVFFLNQGGRLNNVSGDSGLDFKGNSRSAAYLDFDQDGDLDIVVNNYHERARLYRNDAAGAANGWLKIRLVGAPEHKVNRDAIGARVIVSVDNGSRVWRELRGASGYMTVQSRALHFGAGDGRSADVLVLWPNKRQTALENVELNQALEIRYDHASTVESEVHAIY